MTILDRYLLKHLGRSFVQGMLVFLVIFFIAILLGQMDVFVSNQATASQIGRFFFYHLPFIFVQATPMATLLATLFTLGSLSQRNEITAFRANGISLYRISGPILLTALGLSLLTILFNELLVPPANLRFRQILAYEIRKEEFSPFGSRNNIAYRGEAGNVYYTNQFKGEESTLQGVTILRFDQTGTMVGRIDAQKAVYEDGRWQFYEGVERSFADNRLAHSRNFTRESFPLKETPLDFQKRQKMPNEMTYRELKQSVAKQKASGGDYKRDQVYLYFTVSFPFAAFFMSFLAIPFALFNRRSNPVINFGICLIIAFAYWSALAIAHAMGVSGFLPPLLAAWCANVLFGVLGLYFFARAPK